jgi:hypothetical protein
MKKLIATALAASMLITSPAFAEHRKRDRDHTQQERRKSGCGWLCGAIIGGVAVAVLSSSERGRERNQEPRDDNRYYPPDYRYDRRYCVREQITEWRRGERYVYWETRCN